MYQQLKATGIRTLRATEFDGCGWDPGLECFKLKNKKIAKCPPDDPVFQGQLYSKECVLLLLTASSNEDGSQSWQVMTWTENLAAWCPRVS